MTISIKGTLTTQMLTAIADDPGFLSAKMSVACICDEHFSQKKQPDKIISFSKPCSTENKKPGKKIIPGFLF